LIIPGFSSEMPRKSYRQHEKHQIYFYLNESGVFTLYKKVFETSSPGCVSNIGKVGER
jgi:hypothetical protein